jgi:hypothetical protein
MTIITTIVEDMYRAEIRKDELFGNLPFCVTFVYRLDSGYKDRFAECKDLPEALRTLAGFIEEV